MHVTGLVIIIKKPYNHYNIIPKKYNEYYIYLVCIYFEVYLLFTSIYIQRVYIIHTHIYRIQVKEDRQDRTGQRRSTPTQRGKWHNF